MENLGTETIIAGHRYEMGAHRKECLIDAEIDAKATLMDGHVRGCIDFVDVHGTCIELRHIYLIKP